MRLARAIALLEAYLAARAARQIGSAVELALGIVSLLIGSWGAYTAHQARKWQRDREAERRATRVRIEVEQLAEPSRAPRVVWLDDEPVPPTPLRHLIKVIVINDGETTEYVRDVALENDQGQGLSLIDDENHELPPRGRVVADTYVRDPAAGFDFESSPVHGWTRLASGVQITSEPDVLDTLILDHVKAWNERIRR